MIRVARTAIYLLVSAAILLQIMALFDSNRQWVMIKNNRILIEQDHRLMERIASELAYSIKLRDEAYQSRILTQKKLDWIAIHLTGSTTGPTTEPYPFDVPLQPLP